MLIDDFANVIACRANSLSSSRRQFLQLRPNKSLNQTRPALFAVQSITQGLWMEPDAGHEEALFRAPPTERELMIDRSESGATKGSSTSRRGVRQSPVGVHLALWGQRDFL